MRCIASAIRLITLDRWNRAGSIDQRRNKHQSVLLRTVLIFCASSILVCLAYRQLRGSRAKRSPQHGATAQWVSKGGESDLPGDRVRKDSQLRFSKLESAPTITIEPLLHSVPASLGAAWNASLTSLMADAEKLFRNLQSPDYTASELQELQNYLDCTAGEGSFRWDPSGQTLAATGDTLPVYKQSPRSAVCDQRFYAQAATLAETEKKLWHVRPSLKWRWQASERCKTLPHVTATGSQPAARSLPSRGGLCALLDEKRLLLLGDSPSQYAIHDMLLDWTSERPQTCYGDVYCKEHALCQGNLSKIHSDTSGTWKGDVRIYAHLPEPPVQMGESPSSRESSADTARSARDSIRNAILRYRRLDSLFLSGASSHAQLQPAYIDQSSGIRAINMFAVPDIKRSDLIILNKAPIPLPRKFSPNARASSFQNFSHMEPSLMLIEIVENITRTVWLPDLLDAVQSARKTSDNAEQVWIYRGSWQMRFNCTQLRSDESVVAASPSSYYLARTVSGLLGPSGLESSNFHVAYYNVQTVVQNYLVHQVIAPILSMPYLDLDTMTSGWRTGSVAGGDCLRFCLPSPGLSLEEAFIGGLIRVLSWQRGRERFIS